MLIVLQNRISNVSQFDISNNHIVDAMFRARKDVFETKLKWVKSLTPVYEVDEFDNNFPIYLISTDENTGEHLASLRLLPTTGKNMLNSAFRYMFNDDVDLVSPTIMECTRFCANCQDGKSKAMSGQVSKGIAELVLGLHKLSLEFGFTQITGVFSSTMKRFYRKTGWEPEVLASSDDEKCGKVYAGIWDVIANDEQKIRNKLNYFGEVEMYFEDFEAQKIAA